MDESKELEELEREEASEKLAGSSLPPEMRAKLIRARENRKRYESEKNKKIFYGGGVESTTEEYADGPAFQKQSTKNQTGQTEKNGQSRKPGRLTKIGRSMVVAGDALTLTGVGAEVGIPLREIGEVTQHSGKLIDKERERKNDEQNKGKGGAFLSVRNLEKESKKSLEAAKRMAKRGKVTFGGASLMIAVAILFDLVRLGLDLIPFVGWILSPIVGLYGWLTFYVWTSIKGWGLSDTFKKIAVMWVIPSIEVIPILNALPSCTLSIVLQIMFLKAEDALYYGTKGKVDAEQVYSFGETLKSLFGSGN